MSSIYYDLAKYIDTNVVAYQVNIAMALGSPITALVLSQYLYWSRNKTTVQRGGWFYKIESDFYAETGVTPDMQKTARKKLSNLGILMVEKRGVPAKNWYKINYENLILFLEEKMEEPHVWGEEEEGGSHDKKWEKPTTGSGKNRPLSITETTTDISESPDSRTNYHIEPLEAEIKPRTKKYPNAPKVFDLFQEELGYRPANWKINKTQLQAAENLWTEKGPEVIRKALRYYRENKDQPFFPEVGTPYKLDSKWLEIKRFKKQNNG